MATKMRARSVRAPVACAAALSTVLGGWLIAPRQASAQLGSLVVTITSPSSGATVSGTITVSASVSVVGLLVEGVQFQLDGASLGAEDTSAPYSVPWNTTASGNGSHTLVAVGRDSLGILYPSSPVTVTVSNAPPPDTTPPAVSIGSPANGATVSGSITVSATASDNVGVAGVQFLLDGSSLGAEDTSSPYSVSWNTTTAGDGSHTLTATARDAAGNRTTSSAVTVTVSNSSSTTNRYEESAASLAPAGAWTTISSAGAGVTLSGGQAVYAGAAGSTASFTFSGTGASWIGMKCEQCGIATVHLDGSVVATVDTYAPTRPAASGAMYTATGLASASHTLVVEVTGTSNAASAGPLVVVDAFDAEGVASGGGGTTRIEETDPSVSYVGAWNHLSDPRLSGGTGVESSDPNGTATLSFSGVGVSWIGFKGPWAGIAQVYLDGTLKATVDTYAPTEQGPIALYSASGLAADSHALMIKVTYTWNQASTGAWILVDAFDVTSGSGSSSPAPDTTPPTVSITSPSGGATVSGTIKVSATATDDVGVSGVQFLLDGSNLGGEDTASPYSISWDTTTVGNGSHTLTAVARDAAGNRTTSAPVTVTVSSSTPPSATRFEETAATLAPGAAWGQVDSAGAGVTLSGGQAVYSGAAGATATFTFNGTGVSWIGMKCEQCGIARVHLDGLVVATVDTYAPTRPATSGAMYTTTGLAAASHTLVVEVTGTYNAASTGALVVVDAFDVAGATTPPSDTTPPVVSITSPSGGATVSGTITVSATATDDVGVAGVQFLLDGAALGAEDTASPFAVSWTTAGASNGSHTLTATARDAAGNRTTSAPVAVTVSNATAATRFEESAATLAPAASWFGVNSASTGVTLSGDFAVIAPDAGATATFTFSGKGVSWIGFKCERCGIATIHLDGAVIATVDTYAPARPAATSAMFTATGLAAGSHTLVIEVTGTSNASSAGPFIVVDAFDVM